MPGAKHKPLNAELLERTPAEWAYLAGIIDGEGHLSGVTGGQGCGIKVSMSEWQVAYFLHHTFGGVLDRPQSARGSYGRHVKFRWQLNRTRDVQYALLNVMPHLVLKRDEAEALLAYCNHVLARPTYDVPTARCPAQERRRRGAAWQRWAAERERLAAQVRATRDSRKAEWMVSD